MNNSLSIILAEFTKTIDSDTYHPIHFVNINDFVNTYSLYKKLEVSTKKNNELFLVLWTNLEDLVKTEKDVELVRQTFGEYPAIHQPNFLTEYVSLSPQTKHPEFCYFPKEEKVRGFLLENKNSETFYRFKNDLYKIHYYYQRAHMLTDPYISGPKLLERLNNFGTDKWIFSDQIVRFEFW